MNILQNFLRFCVFYGLLSMWHVAANQECFDSGAWCKKELCHFEYFSEMCFKTCSGCSEISCSDIYSECTIYRQFCKHPIWGEKLQKNCKKSCGLCDLNIHSKDNFKCMDKSICQFYSASKCSNLIVADMCAKKCGKC